MIIDFFHNYLFLGSSYLSRSKTENFATKNSYGKNLLKIFIIIFIMMCFTLADLYSNDRLSIGFGYPYVSVKYNPVEIKYATGEGINVYAARWYLNLYKIKRANCFTGIEAGYIDFDTLDIQGTGYEGEILIGGEYFITKTISFMLDISPTYIYLESGEFDVNGIDWVANLAVYYHF